MRCQTCGKVKSWYYADHCICESGKEIVMTSVVSTELPKKGVKTKWGKAKIAEETIQCSLVKSKTVYVEPMAKQKIALLMEAYPRDEWFAYLRGEIVGEDTFVDDITVPPHESFSSGSAVAEPFHVPKGCVGVIHSHHSMGAFHSSTDRDYVDRNHPVSITVARNGGNQLSYDAVSPVKTLCGKSVTVKCVVKYVQPPLTFDRDKFLKKAKDNIEKGGKVCTPLATQVFPVGGYVSQKDMEMFYKDMGWVG